MLKNISWSGYFIFLALVLGAYYITICLKYYKDKIRDIIAGKHNPFQKRISNKPTSNKNNEQLRLKDKQSNEHDLFPVVNQLVEEINYSLEQAAQNNLIKQELVYSLQQLAKKYFQIKASPFQSFITNYILVESSNYSSIHLSEEDVNTMWAI